MYIEQLASGKYRATMMKNGKRYRITYDTKPTKRQAEADLYDLISKEPTSPHHGLTFKEAAEKYVDMKSNVLSPNTVRAKPFLRTAVSSSTKRFEPRGVLNLKRLTILPHSVKRATKVLVPPISIAKYISS